MRKASKQKWESLIESDRFHAPKQYTESKHLLITYANDETLIRVKANKLNNSYVVCWPNLTRHETQVGGRVRHLFSAHILLKSSWICSTESDDDDVEHHFPLMLMFSLQLLLASMSSSPPFFSRRTSRKSLDWKDDIVKFIATVETCINVIGKFIKEKLSFFELQLSVIKRKLSMWEQLLKSNFVLRLLAIPRLSKLNFFHLGEFPLILRRR